MKETSYMLAQTNGTPDESVPLAPYMSAPVRRGAVADARLGLARCPIFIITIFRFWAWLLVVTSAHPYYPLHTLQHVQHDH